MSRPSWRASAQNSVRNNLHLSRAAERDLDSIWEYSARQWGYGQAEALIRRLDAAFDRLSAFPLSGQVADELRQGYRMLTVSNYRVFYRLVETEIEIVRVLHGHMEAGRQLGVDRQPLHPPLDIPYRSL